MTKNHKSKNTMICFSIPIDMGERLYDYAVNLKGSTLSKEVRDILIDHLISEEFEEEMKKLASEKRNRLNRIDQINKLYISKR